MSILAILLLMLGASVCMFILKFLVRPYLRVYSYKNDKNAATYFFPIFGHIKLIFSDLAKHGDSMYTNKVFDRENPGKKYTVTNFNDKTVFVLHDPQYMRDYLMKPDLYGLSQVSEMGRVLMGQGLLFAQGAQWKKHRKLVSASFNYDFLKSLVPTIQKITQEQLAKIDPKDFNDCRSIEEIQKITSEVVGRSFFGERLNDYTFRGNSITTSMAELAAELFLFSKTPLAVFLGSNVMKLNFIPQVADLNRRITEFRETCRKIVASKQASEAMESNLLSILLKTQESKDPSERLHDEEIVDIFITFFVGGTDTTGHLAGMVLYMLTQHPEYQQQLQAERDQGYNQEKIVTIDTLQKMDSLHSVLKETLRMYPPAAQPPSKTALRDHKIGDLKVRKGDLVKAMIISPHFNEKYVQNPYKFEPERWMDGGDRSVDPYAFIPFSAGPRNCIGQHLAIMEAKVIISEFCEKFDFKLNEGMELKMMNRFLYEPIDDVRLVLTPRT